MVAIEDLHAVCGRALSGFIARIEAEPAGLQPIPGRLYGIRMNACHSDGDYPGRHRSAATGVGIRSRYHHGSSGFRIRYPDQDALNLVLLDRWTELEPKWNEMRTWRFEPSQMSKRMSDSRILHFAGPEKPWLDNFPEGRRRRLYHSLMDLVQRGER